MLIIRRLTFNEIIYDLIFSFINPSLCTRFLWLINRRSIWNIIILWETTLLWTCLHTNLGLAVVLLMRQGIHRKKAMATIWTVSNSTLWWIIPWFKSNLVANYFSRQTRKRCLFIGHVILFRTIGFNIKVCWKRLYSSFWKETKPLTQRSFTVSFRMIIRAMRFATSFAMLAFFLL